jgi:hypothetical protein
VPHPKRAGVLLLDRWSWARQRPAAGETSMGEDSFPPSEEPVIRTIAMPADTNPAGDIFGGWLMAQMDLAAGSAPRSWTMCDRGCRPHGFPSPRVRRGRGEPVCRNPACGTDVDNTLCGGMAPKPFRYRDVQGDRSDLYLRGYRRRATPAAGSPGEHSRTRHSGKGTVIRFGFKNKVARYVKINGNLHYITLNPKSMDINRERTLQQ